MTTTIIIPGTFPTMNQIIAASKRHWSEYAKFKRTYTDLIIAATKNRYEPITDYPVHLHIDWYCEDRRVDPDNTSAAKKMVIDGLVSAGILEDDGWAQICELSDAFHIDKGNPRVVVNVLFVERLQ